jgi:hypothetical protein
MREGMSESTLAFILREEQSCGSNVGKVPVTRDAMTKEKEVPPVNDNYLNGTVASKSN